ncbi:hypothetical protein B0H10DRAFT_1998791 [Mycena sp. CBHHK59/15]|nr:hypothetical protein B0H10DRAFT_1998791 [Mycena sp. CBHHK59/15]
MRLQLPGYQERSIARLEFLSTAEISTAVREVFISPYPPGYNRRHKAEYEPVEDVMRELILALPRFHLELEMHPYARGDVPIPARKVLLLNLSTSPTQIFPSAAKTLLKLTFADSIERIVAGATGTESITRAILHVASGLHSLTSLDISLRFTALPDFVAALAQCPNVSSLRFRSAIIDGPVPKILPPLPTDILRKLTSYHGPPHLAPTFAQRRTLLTVRLWSSHGVSGVSAPFVLEPILPQLGNSVELLEIGVTTASASLLETIHHSFPALKSLAINAHLDTFHPGTVARHTLHTAVVARLALPPEFVLDTLRLGAQMSSGAPEEMVGPSQETIENFPLTYDPTSWRLWTVEKPWMCIRWTRMAEADVVLRGVVSIEYGEHYFQSFERGARISDEAVSRLQ